MHPGRDARRTLAALVTLAALLPALAGCARVPQLPPGEMPRTALWTCDPGPAELTTTFDDDGGMVMEGPGGATAFRVAISASGARYVAPGRQFWIKGSQAYYDAAGAEALCREDPRRSWREDARRRGATLRATGNEPGWTLEIGPERLYLADDYGRTRLAFPAAAPEVRGGGAERVWRARAAGHSLEVRVLAGPCVDDMSGEAFDFTVELTLDGTPRRGCAEAVR